MSEERPQNGKPPSAREYPAAGKCLVDEVEREKREQQLEEALDLLDEAQDQLIHVQQMHRNRKDDELPETLLEDIEDLLKRAGRREAV